MPQTTTTTTTTSTVRRTDAFCLFSKGGDVHSLSKATLTLFTYREVGGKAKDRMCSRAASAHTQLACYLRYCEARYLADLCFNLPNLNSTWIRKRPDCDDVKYESKRFPPINRACARTVVAPYGQMLVCAICGTTDHGGAFVLNRLWIWNTNNGRTQCSSPVAFYYYFLTTVLRKTHTRRCVLPSTIAKD
jgi:hypothetical protein